MRVANARRESVACDGRGPGWAPVSIGCYPSAVEDRRPCRLHGVTRTWDTKPLSCPSATLSRHVLVPPLPAMADPGHAMLGFHRGRTERVGAWRDAMAATSGGKCRHRHSDFVSSERVTSLRDSLRRGRTVMMRDLDCEREGLRPKGVPRSSSRGPSREKVRSLCPEPCETTFPSSSLMNAACRFVGVRRRGGLVAVASRRALPAVRGGRGDAGGAPAEPARPRGLNDSATLLPPRGAGHPLAPWYTSGTRYRCFMGDVSGW